MGRLSASVLLATAYVVLGSGCGTIVEHELGWDVSPSYTELTEEQPSDIPVPAGFDLVTGTKKSFSIDLKNGGYREAHLVYSGRNTVESAARFFEKTMVLPTYGWRNQSPLQNEGDRTLKFVKGGAICTIVLGETKSGALPRTRIEVDLVSQITDR